MSLRFIYGKSGTGKSEYIFNQISKLQEKTDNIYIITPEQFSYTTERKLLDSLNQSSATLNAEVLTFNRMAYRIINQVYGRTNVTLTKAGKAMLIYSILLKHKKNLKFLNKSNENVELLSKTITEFKKHGIKTKILSNAIETVDDMYLKTKLLDLNLIYENYCNSISNKYIDENDVLDILIENITKTDMFKNSIIYIDEFSGFTQQEYTIIENLLNLSKQLNISICTDSLEETLTKENDIFYQNKITISKIVDIAKNLNIKIEEPIQLKQPHRFKNEELKHLEQNMYSTKTVKYEKPCNNISIFLSNNPYSELENIASDIIYKARENKIRYKDIAIITKNIDTYSNLIKAIFSKYNIPVFIDEKKDLNQNVLIKYILSILEIFEKNWSYEAVFNYLKTGLVNIDNLDLYTLENYCIKWGIRGSKWYKNDWDMGDEKEETYIKLNNLRSKIIKPLLEFKENLTKNKNAFNISKQIYNFLISQNINTILEEKINELEQNNMLEIANEYKMSWDIIINLLDEIILIFGKENITFEKYIEIFKIGIQNSDLGKIPETLDQVVISDIERSRTHKVKQVYIIGVNDGTFPSVNKNEGFLNDNDRHLLKQNNIQLAKDTLENLYEDNYNIYKAFTTAEENLNISYVSTDNEGKAVRPSILITKMKKIFPNIIEDSDVIQAKDHITTKDITFDLMLLNIRKHLDNEQINPIWFKVYQYYKNSNEYNKKLEKNIKAIRYTNLPTKLTENTIKKVYKDKLNVSISKLEQYRACPFSFYLKYNLKLKDKRKFKLESIDTGSFMHEVINEFFEAVKQNNLSEIDENQIEKIVSQIIDQKLEIPKNYIFTSSAKFKILTQKLKKLIIKSLKYIVKTIEQSDFNILGNEIEFTNNKRKETICYDPITIDLSNGKKLEVIGKIDRIDIAKVDNKKYIRIIDYKSSAKDINLNEVYVGLQIQLLTYLDAINKEEDAITSGILYFNLIDHIIKAKKNLTEEEIQEKISKEFKMHGLIVSDIKIVKMMDKKLEKGYSDLIPAYIGTDGFLSNKLSNAISIEEFALLQKHIKTTIKKISNEILEGNININPYNNKNITPCKFCEYKTICQFNKNFKGNEYNYIENLTKKEVLEKIKQECEK